MSKCWNESPHRRPTFEMIHSTLKGGSISRQRFVSSRQLPLATTMSGQQQQERRIPFPVKHGLADSTVDVRSDQYGRTWHHNTREAKSSYARSSVATVFEQRPSRYHDDLSTSTRVMMDPDRATLVPYASPADTPHDGGAAAPEHTPMGQGITFTRTSPGPSDAPLFSVLGQSRRVLNEKITYAERMERHQEGKVTSLDGVHDSAEKMSLSLDIASGVVQTLRPRDSFRSMA